MPLTHEKFGVRLKALRRQKNITQRDLASAAEVSGEFISRMERGLTFPALPTFARITAKLGCSADALLFDTTADSVGVKNRFDLLVRGTDSHFRDRARLAVCHYMDFWSHKLA